MIAWRSIFAGLALALVAAALIAAKGPFALAFALLFPIALLWMKDGDERITLTLLILSAAWIPWQTFSFHKNAHFYLYPLFPIIQFLFLKLMLKNNFRLPRLGIVDLLSVLFLLSAVLSTFHAVINPGWSVRYIYGVLFGGYIFYLSLKILTENDRSTPVALWNLFQRAILVSAGYAVVEYVLKYNVLYPNVPFMSLENPDSTSVVYRASSTFEHPLTAAHLFAISIPYWFARSMRHPRTFANYGALFLLFIALLASGSRSGMLVSLLACVLVMLLLLLYSQWNFRTILTIFLFLVVALIGSSFLSSQFKRSFSLFGSSIQSSDSNRWNSMQWAFTVFDDYWVWGMGPLNSDYIKMTDAFSALSLSTDFGLENSWFSLLLEQGIIGVIVFILLHLWTLTRLLVAIPRLSPDDRIWAISIFTALLSFAVLFATRNAAHVYFTWFVYFMLFYTAEQLANRAVAHRPAALTESTKGHSS